ncbi:MAG: UDP-glucose 4-epimerase GalE [Glaciecola sp.]
MNKILVTGGSGYIGSHTVLQLLEQGREVVVIDNLCNSSPEALKRVSELSGKDITFVKGDIRSYQDLQAIFDNHTISDVIHFAGLKAVGESVNVPLTYYENNVYGTINLCHVMQDYGVKNLVFSSSATVYGDPQSLPLNEKMPTGKPTNPYGHSKLMVENVLRDVYASDASWNIVLLRYFNPVGAHHSGRIGEVPNGVPNNLMPFISQTATGKREILSIFGNDYDTPDGTGVRDYIHVVDLAAGHLCALDAIAKTGGLLTVNLGTGTGYSVLEMVNAFSRVSGVDVPYQFVTRRSGDVAACYADPSYAKEVLGWEAHKSLEDMCADTWRWQSQNPNGY